MSDLKHPFVMFPSRIWNLPKITVQLLKFYEKIFQFWHQGHECFLGNKTLMEYSGMKSDSTVRDAFTYFESHGELKRVMRNGKRYIIPPTPRLSTDSVDNLPKNSSNSVHTSAVALGGERCGAGGTSAVALPNNINIIIKNNEKLLSENEQKKHKAVDKRNRQDWKEANQAKHSWADKAKEPPRADVTKQSTSYDPSKHDDTKRFDPNAPGYQAFLNANPAIKRAHERRKKNASQTNELPTGTPVQSEVSTPSLSDSQSAETDDGRQETHSPRVRSANRVMETRGIRSLLEEAGMAGSH
jgi:hypothetical protein